MITTALRDLVANADTLKPYLARWDFGEGLLSAVFTHAPAPETCPNPVLTIEESGEGADASTRGFRGREYLYELNYWGDKSYTRKALRAGATALWELLDRTHLEIEGKLTYPIRCSAPESVTDDEGFPGYRFSLMVTVAETEE